jgi:hypothetical protein
MRRSAILRHAMRAGKIQDYESVGAPSDKRRRGTKHAEIEPQRTQRIQKQMLFNAFLLHPFVLFVLYVDCGAAWHRTELTRLHALQKSS